MLEGDILKDNRSFKLRKENFSEVTSQVHDELVKMKISGKEVGRADLLLEENFMRMNEIGGLEEVEVKIKKKFGDVTLQLESKGSAYNPLVEITDFDEEDEDYFRTMILKANRSKMSYNFRAGKNILVIQVHHGGNKQIYYTLGGMFFGIIFGLLITNFCSADLITTIDKGFIKSIRTMFLNALNMMLVPVIFFSVISGITSVSNAADIGRIGGKLMSFYTLTTIIASALSVLIGYFMFSGGVPQIGTADTTSATASEKISVIDTIVALIPNNLIVPIEEGEMLQIIFLAVVFGICIIKLGDQVKLLHEIIEEMNKFCLKMIGMIVSFIPIVAFVSMASLVINVGMDSVLMLGGLIFGQLFGSVLMVGVYLTLLVIFGKVSPLPFLKKIGSYISVPFSTSSSNAAMPFTMKFCTEKIGVDPKLSSFSIPVGATVNMDGGCLYLSIASIMLAGMYGLDLNTDVLFTIFITVIALSIGAPGVPGGAFVCLASIVVALGLPKEATAVVLGIDPICSMLRSALNSTGDIAVTSALAGNEKLLDKDIYNKL